MLTDAEWTALWLSAEVALWAVAVSVVPGVLCAWVLARGRFRGKALLDAIVHLPLVLPPVVTGYALLLLLGRGGLDLGIAFTRTAAVIAAAVMGFPLLVRASRLGIEMVDRGLEDAARTLGAGRWRRLVTITVPLALPGILTGVVLALARGLGEFGATITFAGNFAGETRTLPLAVYTFTQTPGGDGPALRLVAISVVLSLAALLASEVLARRVSQRLGSR
ncbi:MAG: molybdate ABC transporter permease subunit [Planctomycetota bacterium]